MFWLKRMHPPADPIEDALDQCHRILRLLDDCVERAAMRIEKNKAAHAVLRAENEALLAQIEQAGHIQAKLYELMEL